MEESELLFKQVFRKGLVLMSTKENKLNPLVLIKYKEYCESITNQTQVTDLGILSGLARQCLAMLLQNPSAPIPVTTFEP